MRLATMILAGSALIAGIASASAKTNTGGGGTGGSCQYCSAHVTGGIGDLPMTVYTCETAHFTGRRECHTGTLNLTCTESGDYCGFFFPSPNPVIA